VSCGAAATHTCKKLDSCYSIETRGCGQTAHIAKVGKGAILIYAEDTDRAIAPQEQKPIAKGP
jgi:hypothetical protein